MVTLGTLLSLMWKGKQAISQRRRHHFELTFEFAFQGS